MKTKIKLLNEKQSLTMGFEGIEVDEWKMAIRKRSGEGKMNKTNQSYHKPNL